MNAAKQPKQHTTLDQRNEHATASYNAA